MQCEVLRASDLTRRHEDAWLDLLKQDRRWRSPFFRPEFVKAVAAVRTDVHVSIIEDATGIVGVFPFQRGMLGQGRPVGGAVSDYHDVILRSGVSLDVEKLVAISGLSAWHFTNAPAMQDTLGPYQSSCHVAPLIDLSGGYEAYHRDMQAKRSRWITRLARKMRKLENDVGPLRFQPAIQDERVLQQLIGWKREQYRRTGVVDILSAQWTRRLLQDVLSRDGVDMCGLLSGLFAADELIAAHMGLRSHDVWHHWFPAFSRRFAPYSPGLILLVKMIKSAEPLGIRTIDMGAGLYEYKRHAMNGACRLARGKVEVPSLRGALAQACRWVEMSGRRRAWAGPLAAVVKGVRAVQRYRETH